MEAALTADYNAEMIGHIARHPSVRDQAIFVGNPDDVVPDSFGPDLPAIRDWTGDHYSFSGYITGFDPAEVADRAGLRQELSYGEDKQICVVTVGGSGVGGHLLRRVLESFPHAKRLIPGLRMVVVAGPRIDPATLPRGDGLGHPSLCARAVPASGRLRRGGGAGRAHYGNGADRQPPALSLLPVAAPL